MMANRVAVWDPLVRIFHWSLVAFFAIAYLTGDELETLHVYAGYAVLGLIAFRLVWGFIGGRHARFKDFIVMPGAVIEYLKRLKQRTPPHYLGHNPAGGYMVLALLIMLTVVTVTGLEVYGIEGHGPLAASGVVASAERTPLTAAERSRRRFWKEIHELASNLTLALVGLHILGVIVSSRMHNENLIKAMITGKKDTTGQD